MSFFTWKDIDLLAGNIKTGTITKVDRAAKTVDIEGVGTNIPVHYHCNKDDVDDDGAGIEGSYPTPSDEKGISAFSVGNVASVMFRQTGDRSAMVIGFEGEDKQCCVYKFKVFGPDCSGGGSGGSGEVGPAEGTGGYTGGSGITENVFFTVYGPNKESVPLEDPAEYDEDEECWNFIPKPTEDVDYDCSEPFWVQVFSPGYKPSQYAGRTEPEDRWSHGDLISADGEIREEYLVCYEGEVGYWEDWSEGICGKHQWQVLVNAHSGGPGGSESCRNAGLCVASPSICTTSLAQSSYSISNNVLNCFASASSGEYTGYSNCWIYQYFDPRKRLDRLVLKIPSYSSSSSGDDAILWGDFYFWLYDSEGAFYKDLRLFFAWSNYTTMEGYAGERELYVSITEDIDAAGGEFFLIDFINDPRFLSLEKGSSIGGMSITLTTHHNASVSLTCDVIHFPHWEDWRDWDNPSEDNTNICKNNTPWQFYVHTEGSPGAEWENCPALPFTYSYTSPPHEGEPPQQIDHLIEIKDGTLFWTGYNKYLGSSQAVQLNWLGDNTPDKYISGITSLVLKLKAFVSNESDAALYVELVNENGNSVSLCLTGTPYDPLVPIIGDNDGEEQIINLEEKTAAFVFWHEDVKIKRVSFWLGANNLREDGEVIEDVTMFLQVNYIDFT